MTSKKDYQNGMRIKLEGLHSLHDIEVMIHEAFDKLRDRGVYHANAGNLYINISDPNGSPVHLREYPSNTMVMNNPYRSIADDHGI